MKNLQEIKSVQQNKYDEIVEFLRQDNGYWFENDKWDLTEEFFIGEKIYTSRYIIENNISNKQEMRGIPPIIDFIKDFYDDREETEKDIWYSIIILWI